MPQPIDFSPAPDAPTPQLARLANGVAVITVPLPRARTASVSVFLRAGSVHEPRRLSGISHLVEHMVFKGSATRDCRQINLDAECLGAEVNAHTDKDHAAFHMRGLAQHAGDFIRMLGDIVLAPRFPADELDREREVVLQELAEDDDDPMSAAFKLLDAAAHGTHPVARPIIGQRRTLEAVTRDDLVAHVRTLYTGANTVVAVAGPVDADAIARQVEAVFGAMPAGAPQRVPAAAWLGGFRSRNMAGSSQTHLVLGLPIPPQPADDVASHLAAAVFGEGMSSPLLDELREKRGLVYYAACSADVLDCSGQMVIEASTSPEQADECLATLTRLLAAQAERIDAVDLMRARNQLLVRRLRQVERPHRLIEGLALDWLSLGRLRHPDEQAQRLLAADADAVRQAFARAIGQGAALAVSGRVPRGLRHRLDGLLAVPLGGGPVIAAR